MTKSTLRLAREALRSGRTGLPPYSSRFSRHDFTQPQLFALLVVRQALRLDYRGLVTLLTEWAELRRALGLRKAPHYSTLCYAARRLVKGGPFIGSKARAAAGPSRADSSARRLRSPSMLPGSDAPCQRLLRRSPRGAVDAAGPN
jgi:hypothetical protein